MKFLLNTGARLDEQYVMFITIDVIVDAVCDRVINGYATPTKSDIWDAFYEELYNYNQPNDKVDFENWFIFSINEARKRKRFII